MATVTLSLPTLDHLQAAKRETILRPSSLEQYSLPFHPLHKDIPPGVTVGLEGDQPPDRLDGSSSCQVGERWSLQHREDRLGVPTYDCSTCNRSSCNCSTCNWSRCNRSSCNWSSQRRASHLVQAEEGLASQRPHHLGLSKLEETEAKRRNYQHLVVRRSLKE